MDRVEVVVIGAGVVGLSVAASLAEAGREVLLIEQHTSFGQESSSRNSEVIHASIYYPPDSLKGQLCLEGNERLYDLCEKHDIPCARTGKLIVAWTEELESQLPDLLATAQGNGAKGVRIVDREEIHSLDPLVEARAALWCPTSGVVDSHRLMVHFRAVALSGGAQEVYGAEVVGLEQLSAGWKVAVREASGEIAAVESSVVVNCAGLGAGRVAQMAGIDPDEARYRIHYRKGVYFRVMRGLERLPKRLIYPVPPQDATVGIHTCPDLAGGMRLGPWDAWSETLDYSVDPGLRGHFFESVRDFLPGLREEDLEADMAGFQAKRYGPGEESRDFVIRHEADRGLDGLVNLIGIESPGLTSSPAIGPTVARMVEEILK